MHSIKYKSYSGLTRLGSLSHDSSLERAREAATFNFKKNSHNIEPAATLPGTVGSSEEWLGKYGTKE